MTLNDHPGHITAEQILERIRPRYPYLNLSTVYRTLDLLTSLGLVTETDVGEGARAFELIGSRPHHHLICQGCGITVEIDDSVLEPLRERLLQQYGFAARMEHFAIFGLCAKCQAASGQSRPSPA